MQEYRFMFLRGKNNHPVGCMAMRSYPGVASTKVVYQVSTLNPEDKFNRKMARHLALGRLVERPIVFYVEKNKINIHETTKAIMEHVSSSARFPKRSRMAAKHWVSNNKFIGRQ
jgi:hypothetical protein